MDARRQLAAIHVDQGRYDQAEAEFRDTRRQLITRLGPNHPDVARDDNSLAIIAWERGQIRQALASLDHAVAILRQAPGTNLLASILFNKAMVLHDANADAEALPMLQEARVLRVRQLGATHPLVGDTDRLLGEVEASLGNRAPAERAFASAVALTRVGYGPAHPHTYRAMLSQARHRAGHDAEAMPVALRELDAIARIAGTDAESTKLRWRARAFAAEARCRSDAGALDTLRALEAEVSRAQRQGGELIRQITVIRIACQGSGDRTRPSLK